MIDIFTGTKGLIFDCDGTLLDTMPAWNRAEDEMMRLAGRPFTPEEATILRAAPATQLGDLFHDMFDIGESGDEVLQMLDDMLLELYLTGAEALPGVADVLAHASHLGIPCTVVTSSPRRYVQPGLKRAGLLGYFQEICTTDEVGIAKSEPGIYEHAMAVMGSTPGTTWGIDDALYAVRAMNAVGLRTVGTYDCDETGTWEQLQQHATVAVRDLGELLG